MKRTRGMAGLLQALSRRQFVQGTAAVGLTVTGLPAIASAEEKKLNFYNWDTYIGETTLDDFKAATGIEVTMDLFADNDELFAKLREGNPGYDVIFPGDYTVESLIKLKKLIPLDRSKLPNIKNIDPDPNFSNPAFNPGLKYGVPYFWGTMGIAYRKDLVPAPLTSWMDILQPAGYLHGRIGMVENSRDALGMALKALGYSANSTDSKQIKAAEQLLLAQKPYVKTYTYIALNEESALVTGDIIATMIYSGDALMVQEHHEEIDYVVPTEGGNIWVDYLVVLENSRNKELARAFLNFLNEPENAAQLAEFVYYATPNKGAEKLLPAEFLEDPVIYPSQAVLSRSEFYKPLPPRAMKKRNIAFSRTLQ